MRTRRTMSFLASAAAVATTVVLFPSAPAARADGGLSVQSTYTYTVDPAANVVHVVADMSFTNTVPNRVDGNYINKTYYHGFSLPLPVEAINPAGTQNGTALTLTPDFIDGSEVYFLLNVEFAGNLFYQQTAHVIVTYDIIGQVPRTDKPTRVNGAYAAFNAYGIGDAGKLTVRVAVPAGYQIDTLGDDTAITEENGFTVYTASDIDQPDEFDLFISARNDAALTSETVTVGASQFIVRAWPGDDEWNAFIDKHITEGVPLLEELIGQPWPVTGSVEVREAVTPYLYGYAGWFDPDRREVEVGEALDPQTIVHELSHAWFNDQWFDERWISEGLAQAYAGLANEQLDHPAVSPNPIDTTAPGAVQLNEWSTPDFTDGADEQEDYGYNASWFVIDAIVDEIGVEGMRSVFAAIATGEMTYTGDVAGEIDFDPLHDWRRFLDLVERAGAVHARDLFDQYALTPPQQGMVDDRGEARTGYDALDAAGGEWAPPVGVRDAMSDWRFSQAEELIDAAEAVLDQRDDLEAILEPFGLSIDPSFEASFEHATDGYGELSDDLDASIAAASRVAETDDRLTALLDDLGTSATPDLAAVAFPDDVDLDAAQASLDDLVAASEEVVAARDAVAADRSFYEGVGLYGTDTDAMVDDAIAAIARGDADGARQRAADAERAIDRSDALGRSRVLRASLGAGGAISMIIALVVVIVVRKRRRRRAAAVNTGHPGQPADTAESLELGEAGEPGDHGEEPELADTL